MTTITASTSTTDADGTSAAPDLKGIVVVSVPVTDLARSAAWYRDLLGLTYIREFGNDRGVTGCSLVDWRVRYMINLRLRATTAGKADLRGEHPIILEAAGPDAANRLRARASALGIGSTSGTHKDGTWIEFLDPDGIALRIVHSAAGPREFMGVQFGSDADPDLYDTPRLQLPPARGVRSTA